MHTVAVMFAIVFGIALLSCDAQAKPQPVKPLPPSLVSGTYQRTIPGYPATLVVKNAGGRIDFTLTASVERPRKASASVNGVVPIVNNIAIFQKKDQTAQYSISMRFAGSSVIVIYGGTGFGASGVDPAGVYNRVGTISPAKAN